MGFDVAFGLTEYDGSSEWVEDEDYATVQAYEHSWGWKSEGTEIYRINEMHNCTLDELGFEYYKASASEREGMP